MSKHIQKENQIKKPLLEQIIDMMIGKIKTSEYFTDNILTELKHVDLSNKNKVKEAISKELTDIDNEDPETRD